MEMEPEPETETEPETEPGGGGGGERQADKSVSTHTRFPQEDCGLPLNHDFTAIASQRPCLQRLPP